MILTQRIELANVSAQNHVIEGPRSYTRFKDLKML